MEVGKTTPPQSLSDKIDRFPEDIITYYLTQNMAENAPIPNKG